MARGTIVDGRAASASGVGRHMRENLSAPQKLYKILGVIALVGTKTFYLNSLLS